MNPVVYIKKSLSSICAGLCAVLFFTGCSTSSNAGNESRESSVSQSKPVQYQLPADQQKPSLIPPPPEPPSTSTAVPAIVREPDAIYINEGESELKDLIKPPSPKPMGKAQP